MRRDDFQNGMALGILIGAALVMVLERLIT